MTPTERCIRKFVRQLTDHEFRRLSLNPWHQARLKKAVAYLRRRVTR